MGHWWTTSKTATCSGMIDIRVQFQKQQPYWPVTEVNDRVQERFIDRTAGSHTTSSMMMEVADEAAEDVAEAAAAAGVAEAEDDISTTRTGTTIRMMTVWMTVRRTTVATPITIVKVLLATHHLSHVVAGLMPHTQVHINTPT